MRNLVLISLLIVLLSISSSVLSNDYLIYTDRRIYYKLKKDSLLPFVSSEPIYRYTTVVYPPYNSSSFIRLSRQKLGVKPSTLEWLIHQKVRAGHKVVIASNNSEVLIKVLTIPNAVGYYNGTVMVSSVDYKELK